jgi:hypothetical protein
MTAVAVVTTTAAAAAVLFLIINVRVQQPQRQFKETAAQEHMKIIKHQTANKNT